MTLFYPCFTLNGCVCLELGCNFHVIILRVHAGSVRRAYTCFHAQATPQMNCF